MTLSTDNPTIKPWFSKFGARRWLQERASHSIPEPHTLAVDALDIAIGLPSVAELEDLGGFSVDTPLHILPVSTITRALRVSEDLGLSTLLSISDDLSTPFSQIFASTDLWQSIAQGRVDGTLFFLERQANLLGGQANENNIPIVTPSQRERLRTPSAKRFPNLFELLLPILLPPVQADLSSELLLPGELYPFQNYGIQWLTEHPTALLADDMGLGKTIQAIVAFRFLLRQAKVLNALVVCPKSVATSWKKHFDLWAPELQSLHIEGSKVERAILWGDAQRKVHVIITSYETLARDSEEALRGSFDVVIADEIQRIKNSTTQASQALRQLKPKYRWGLTGTPLENRLEDVVSIFHFVRPGLFRWDEGPSIEQAKAKIAPYLLRRRKADVLKELPEKVPDVVYVALGPQQRAIYESLEREGRSHLETASNVTVTHVLALITRLKQICNYDPQSGESSKLDWLEDHIQGAVEEGSKVLVFSQFVQSLRFMEPRLKRFNPQVFSGDLSTSKRDALLEQFKRDDAFQALLLSLRAGGTGLTLTEANYVVHFDSWWNPAVMTQAEDRAHRIGQNKTVFVNTLVSRVTIEERIQHLLDKKRHLFRQVIDDLSDAGLQRLLSEEELFGLFDMTPPRQRRHQPPASQPPSTPAGNKVFRPSEPFSNVVRLREILRECEEYIWWADPHFGSRAFEDLAVVVDPSKVRSIKLLSRREQFTERAKKDFERFCEEMQQKGISVEWRIAEPYPSHDRYIIGANITYNVPPVNSIYQGAYGEGLTTGTRPPFENWWQTATPV